MRYLIASYLNLFIGFNKAVYYRLTANFCTCFKNSIFAFLAIKLSLLGISYHFISIAIFVYALGNIIGSIFSGYIHYNFGCRAILIASNIMAAILLCLLNITFDSFLWLNFVLLFLGVSAGLSKAIYNLELINFKTQYNRSNLMAFSRFVLNLSVGISSLITGYLVTEYFYIGIYIAAILSLIAALIYFLILEKQLVNHKKHIEKTLQVSVYTLIKSNYILILMLAITIIISFIYGFYPSVYTLFLKKYGFNGIFIGYLFLVHTLIIMLIEMPLVNYLNKLRTSIVCACGSLSLSIGFGILFFSQTKLMVAISLVLWTIGEMIQFAIFYVWLMETSNEDYKAKLSGIYFAIYSSFSLISPFIMIGLFDYFNGKLFALLSLILSILLLFLYMVIIRYDYRGSSIKDLVT